MRAGRTAKVVAGYVWTGNPPQSTPPQVLPAPDTSPPGVVTALAATDRTPDSITLSWANPPDVDLAAVIVRRAKGATAPATPTDGTGVTLPGQTATGVTDTGLDPDTTYSYAVFTRDTVGNTSAPATLTTATTASPTVYSVFNYPQPGQGDPKIRDELVGLLDQVPSGAQIEAAFFIITPTYPVVDALIDAHDRGVTVRVVLDSGNRQADSTNDLMDATFQRLRDELGGDTSASSFAMQCDLACISKEEDSIQHNKFVLMSSSGDLDDVVFETTSNMRPGGSGDATWNAAVVSSGNSGVYDSFRAYFKDLAASGVPDNDYNAFRPPVTYGKFTPYYFPRTDGTDTVSNGLKSVDCDASTTIDVMATHFVRTQVRDRLNADGPRRLRGPGDLPGRQHHPRDVRVLRSSGGSEDRGRTVGHGSGYPRQVPDRDRWPGRPAPRVDGQSQPDRQRSAAQRRDVPADRRPGCARRLPDELPDDLGRPQHGPGLRESAVERHLAQTADRRHRRTARRCRYLDRNC